MTSPSKNWPKNNKELTLNQFIKVYEEYRNYFTALGQPYPLFKDLPKDSINKLESALGAVNYKISSGIYHYKPGCIAAAGYLYFVNKSHFLINGNKRASLSAMFGYLSINDKYLLTDWKKIYLIATFIAKSNPSKMKEVIATTARLLYDSIVNYEENYIQGFKVSITNWVKNST